MDVTSISLGESTRDFLRKYKKQHDDANYDEAVRAFLEETTNKIPTELSN